MNAQPKQRDWLTTQEVAPMLQVSEQTFRRNLPDLQREEGFPLQGSLRKRPMLFYRSAVEAWLRTQAQRTHATQEEAELAGHNGATAHVMRLARA